MKNEDTMMARLLYKALRARDREEKLRYEMDADFTRETQVRTRLEAEAREREGRIEELTEKRDQARVDADTWERMYRGADEDRRRLEEAAETLEGQLKAAMARIRELEDRLFIEGGSPEAKHLAAENEGWTHRGDCLWVKEDQA